MSALDFHHRDGPPPPPVPAPPKPTQPVPHDPVRAPTPVVQQPPPQRTPPAKPLLLKTPTGPPVPALTKIGFWGSIDDFNNMVAQQHDTAMKVDGVPPNKKTMLDLVVNPPKPVDHEDVLKEASHSKDYLHIRPDGYTEPKNSVHDKIWGRAQYADEFQPDSMPSKDEAQYNKMRAKTPYIAAGMVPVGDLWKPFMKAIDTLGDRPSEDRDFTIDEQTLDEYKKQAELANAAVTVPGAMLPIANTAEERARIRRRGEVAAAITTVKKVQDKLKELAPAIFVGADGKDLPSNGDFNTDWVSATHKYMTTPLYFRQQTRQLADDNHFGHNTGAFIKAWENKQNMLKRNPWAHQTLMAAPLWMFAEGKAAEDAKRNYFTGDPDGWGWLDLPSWGMVHPLTATAGLVFHGLGGVTANIEADANAVQALLMAVMPSSVALYPGGPQGEGLSFAEAKKKALKVMQETHPAIINLSDPSYGGELKPDEHGGYSRKGGAAGLINEIAVNLMLLKPVFTGERVSAGVSIRDSTYANRSTDLAFNSILRGDHYDAYLALEEGRGAANLIAHTAEHIKNGTMDLSTFRKHADELWRNGATTIHAPESQTIARVYHGTPNDFEAYEISQGGSTLAGPGVYVAWDPKYASLYAERKNIYTQGHVTDRDSPRVNVHRIDTSTLLDASAKDEKYVADAKNRIEGALTPSQLALLKSTQGVEDIGLSTSTPSFSWSEAKDARGMQKVLTEVGQHVTGGYQSGQAWANQILSEAGYTGLVFDHGPAAQAVIFHPKYLLPGFPEGEQINGALFASLRSKHLPTPSETWMDVKAGVKRIGDDFEKALTKDGQRKYTPGSSHALDFMLAVRQGFRRVQPRNEMRRIYDERLAEDVLNWIRVNLKDEGLAKQSANSIVTMQGSNNTAGIVALHTKLRELFTEAHPNRTIERDPFMPSGVPELESENRAYLYFPDALDTLALRTGRNLNKAARIHREALVAGPYSGSVGWKHTFADLMRRIFGGGGVSWTGVTHDLKATEAEVKAYLIENPAEIRGLSADRAASTMGEYKWYAEMGNDPVSFPTGKPVDAQGLTMDDKIWKKAAGSYLRHSISSNALRAYLKSSSADRGPLITYLLQSRDFRSMMFNKEDYLEEVKIIRAQYTLAPGAEKVMGVSREYLQAELEKIKASALKELEEEHARLWAQVLVRRYKEIEDAGHKAGLAHPLDEALEVLVNNTGEKADMALGNWISEKNINLNVHDGLIKENRWDDWMNHWIKFLMTPNRFNRRVLFDHVFYGQVKELRAAGWSMENAIPVATDLARRQTVYHMLDFSNALKIEQDYRWISYFLTKPRLYWTWILATAKQRPGLAAAVATVQPAVDDKGNVNITIGGMDIAIPAVKLFWLNEHSFPMISPILQFGGTFVKSTIQGEGVDAYGNAISALAGTSGDLITRDDSTIQMFAKLVGIKSGLIPATADAVTSGMGKSQKLYFQLAVNKYAVFYHTQHGRWPTEEEAVQWTIVHSTAQHFWRTNQPLPFNFADSTETPDAVQKKLDQYRKIAVPYEARLFLDQNPDVALRLGVSEDPKVFLHVNPLWEEYNKQRAVLEEKQNELFSKVVSSGYTLKIDKEVRAMSKWWSGIINELLKKDSATWEGTEAFPKNAPNGEALPGPWAVQLNGDPLAVTAFIHESFPNVPVKDLREHTITDTVIQLRKEASLIRDAGVDEKKLGELGFYTDADATAYSKAKERLSGINKRLAPLNAFPRNALAKIRNVYYDDYVQPYLDERDKRRLAVQLDPEQDMARQELRTWKDEHDHPITITFEGKKVTFPSPVQLGWASMPADLHRQALAQVASGKWEHTASYEKNMLGVERSVEVSQGWREYTKIMRIYNQDPSTTPTTKDARLALAKAINQAYPGFLNDYAFAQQPKIDRFMHTTLYRTMPDKAVFDENIMTPAKAIADQIRQYGDKTPDGISRSRVWQKFVREQVDPWLKDHPLLQREILLYNPRFLYTLVKP